VAAAQDDSETGASAQAGRADASADATANDARTNGVQSQAGANVRGADAGARVNGDSRVVPNEGAQLREEGRFSGRARDDDQVREPVNDQDGDRRNADDRESLPSGRAALGVSLGDRLMITRVTPNSPAARMGLRTGDRIISVNGEEFHEIDPFITAVGGLAIDQDARIVYLRNGQTFTTTGPLVAWDAVYAAPGFSGQRTYGYGPGDVIAGESYSPAVPADAGVCCAEAPVDPCCGDGYFVDGGFFGGGWFGPSRFDGRYDGGGRRAPRRYWRGYW
jgi:membrane-associated protease RseP (regulator of RpoE activity)